MIRTFQTHRIRRQEELSGALWQFSPCEGEMAGNVYQVAVPSAWECYPDFEAYRGRASYTRRFKVERSGRIRLEFKGVSHTADVFVDGKLAAHHYNAFTPFEAVVNLEAGQHELRVEVDNHYSEDSALHVPNDYQTYGGITRAVALEYLPDFHIQWVHAVPVEERGVWGLKLEACIRNLSSQIREGEVWISLEGCATASAETESLMLEADGKDPQSACCMGTVLAEGGQGVTVKKTVWTSQAREWSMEAPNLYLLCAVLRENGTDVDDWMDRVGFRTVRTEGRRILINGRPVLIKGFCRHEDHPQFGCALPYEAMDYDLNVMLHLGANSVRTSHYPNDEVFLDLCDEKGILVWEENHARGLSEEQMRNPNFDRQCEECNREMVTAHFNHPAIYIWGLLNECADDTEYGSRCYQKQLEQIRTLDDSRPRTYACCHVKQEKSLFMPEVYSYNIYPMWYVDREPEEMAQDIRSWAVETFGEKPFLISEIGAGAIYGYRTPAKVKWSEEYQAETLRKQITSVLDSGFCEGVYIWQYCDVRVSDEWFYRRPRTMNNKGIVDEYRRRKLSYDVVKELYSTRGNYWE